MVLSESPTHCGAPRRTSTTCRPSSRDTFKRVMSGKLSMRVAILNASWASLKMCDEEWMFFWMDSNTVSSLRTSPTRTKGKPNQMESNVGKAMQIEKSHATTHGANPEDKGQETQSTGSLPREVPSWDRCYD